MNNIPRCEHPRPDRRREQWLNLNGTWDFEIDNARQGQEKNFQARAALDSHICVPFCPESRLSGIGHTDFMNAVWYRRDLDIPDEWGGMHIILHIDACDYKTHVYINGRLAGVHSGGYTPMAFDITDLLKGSGNYMTVYAEDDVRSGKQFAGKQSTRLSSYGCFYTRTTGIWQTVWLEACPAAHILSYRAFPSVCDRSVTLEVKGNKESILGDLKVTAYYEGKEMGSAACRMLSDTCKIHIPLSEEHLWEVGHGRLYDLKFELSKGDTTDTMYGYFGLREVSLDIEHGIMINGKTVFGRFVLDQGFYPDGIYTAPSDEALIYDIETSMACGFNGARLHQKVFEPRFLYHADRLGYMVFGEAGNWGFDYTRFENIKYFLPEWLEELERDLSHPSIIGWCPFNETWDICGRQHSVELIDAIYDVTKAIDNTRIVIADSGSFPTSRTDVFDVHDYEQDVERFKDNYKDAARGVIRDQIARSDPHRQHFDTSLPVFVSEYGGIKWAVATDGDAWGYGESVTDEQGYFDRLEGLTDALLSNKRIFGYCYTQLTDVEQEQNGIMTYDRRLKFPSEKYRRIFGKIAAIEEKA